jgi:hypothetical protein
MAPSVSYSITVRLEMAHYIIPSVLHPDVASSVAVTDASTQQPER